MVLRALAVGHCETDRWPWGEKIPIARSNHVRIKMATNNENLVKTTFSVSENAAAKAANKSDEISVSWDFSGVTRNHLIAYALRSLQIALQSEMRGLPVKEKNPQKWSAVVKEYNGLTVNVLADFVNGSRKRLSNEEKAIREVAKMSDAQKTAMIAELTKSMKK
jgi:hypothetical protein